jgi:hypothetical protein
VSRQTAVFGSQKREGGRTSRKTISLKPQPLGLPTRPQSARRSAGRTKQDCERKKLPIEDFLLIVEKHESRKKPEK